MSEKKLTDNENIKALECCVSSGDCKGCPSYIEKDDDCLGIDWLSILDLINHQKAENDKLKEYNDNLLAANTALSNEILEAKAEAVKEFAEKFEKKLVELECSMPRSHILNKTMQIYKAIPKMILKEMGRDSNV